MFLTDPRVLNFIKENLFFKKTSKKKFEAKNCRNKSAFTQSMLTHAKKRNNNSNRYSQILGIEEIWKQKKSPYKNKNKLQTTKKK